MNKTSAIPLRTGRNMPALGLGTWQMEKPVESVGKAIELGYRMIDTSGDYGTQPGVGEALRQSSVDRKDIYLITKVEEHQDAYASSLDNLRELGQDYVNLMLIHRPPERGVGVKLWDGLIRAKREGLAIDIGVSNYSVDQLEALIAHSHETPVVNQIEWSPFGHSREMYDYCQNRGIVIMAYSPLTRQTRLNDDILDRIAGHYNKSPAQVLIRWNIQLGVVPIIKASSESHLEENFDVFDFQLTQEEMDEISNLNEYYSSLGPKPKYVENR